MGFKAASDRESVSRGAFFLDEKAGRTWSPLIGVGKDCRQPVLEIQNDSALFYPRVAGPTRIVGTCRAFEFQNKRVRRCFEA